MAKVNNTQYPDYILEDVRKNMGLDAEDDSQDDEIMAMNKSEVLDRYFTWNGIIGYGDSIIEVVQDIYSVELKDEATDDNEE